MTVAVIWNLVGLSFAVAILTWYGRLTLITWREERHSDGEGRARPFDTVIQFSDIFPGVTDFNVYKVEDQRLIFGWANIAATADGQPVLDAHGDIIEPGVLEKAAYGFNLNFRDAGQMHSGGSIGRLVESFMVTPEKLVAMGLPADALPVGLWVGFKIDDADVWAKVKDGTYPMFSIQGRARREAA